jgi:tetratricopeptide (TPR) repeat protein
MKFRRLTAMLVLALASATAAAAPDVKSRLTSYETEARALASNLPQPNQMSTQTGQRRLVDAQVAFAIGDYDTASLALFDLVGKTSGTDKEIAQFYLAESLYQKGDRGAARAYYQELIAASNAASRYYTPALVRIVEIAITEADAASAEHALGQLGGGRPVVPYIQGKYAFSQGKYDDAIGMFASVPKGSEYELQAAYYTGTAQVAKQDVAKATEIFNDLIDRKPRTNSDRRVIELAQLALGRLYYEREQPSKSIDAYLLVDRRSDLFPAALYEVAWVYVKSKQYDKALTALELLGRLDPQSTTTPRVKILEGNLRIRKAQMLRQAQIAGTANTEEKSTPVAEYTKAEKLFTDTNAAYLPAYMALSRMVDGTLDPASYIDQIAGRTTHVFASAAPIPEAAAHWLREEPDEQRVVGVETDRGSVQRHLDESTATIDRLEGVLATGDRLTLYPALSSRRLRIAAIQHDLIAIRNDLADKAIAGGGSSGATAQRKALASQYAALGDPERAHGERTGQAQASYDAVGDGALEVQKAIMETQAIAVALRTYAVSGLMADDARNTLQTEIQTATTEAQSIEDELASIDREIVLGKDLAGVGDADWQRARELRAQLVAALNAENQGFTSQGRSSALADQAARLAVQLDQTDAQIDSMISRGIDEIKATLTKERASVAEYRQLLAEYEAEARELGASLLGKSFKDVKDKLYDVVIRTDVGNVDVAWSQKEDNDDDLKRLGLAKSRDLKQLRDEFKFVLDETTPTPAQPKLSPLPAASTEGGASPDKGGGDTRIKPIEGSTTTGSPQPVVKPDNNTAPKAPAPKTPAPKTGGAQ